MSGFIESGCDDDKSHSATPSATHHTLPNEAPTCYDIQYTCSCRFTEQQFRAMVTLDYT